MYEVLKGNTSHFKITVLQVEDDNSIEEVAIIKSPVKKFGVCLMSGDGEDEEAYTCNGKKMVMEREYEEKWKEKQNIVQIKELKLHCNHVYVLIFVFAKWSYSRVVLVGKYSNNLGVWFDGSYLFFPWEHEHELTIIDMYLFLCKCGTKTKFFNLLIIYITLNFPHQLPYTPICFC